ncbi:MAG: hypothetical protein IKF52_06840 [Clostridia bacterium]|nr:hypothetical protein [Clostridia bacterium]
MKFDGWAEVEMDDMSSAEMGAVYRALLDECSEIVLLVDGMPIKCSITSLNFEKDPSCFYEYDDMKKTKTVSDTADEETVESDPEIVEEDDVDFEAEVEEEVESDPEIVEEDDVDFEAEVEEEAESDSEIVEEDDVEENVEPEEEDVPLSEPIQKLFAMPDIANSVKFIADKDMSIEKRVSFMTFKLFEANNCGLKRSAFERIVNAAVNGKVNEWEFPDEIITAADVRMVDVQKFEKILNLYLYESPKKKGLFGLGKKNDVEVYHKVDILEFLRELQKVCLNDSEMESIYRS